MKRATRLTLDWSSCIWKTTFHDIKIFLYIWTTVYSQELHVIPVEIPIWDYLHSKPTKQTNVKWILVHFRIDLNKRHSKCRTANLRWENIKMWHCCVSVRSHDAYIDEWIVRNTFQYDSVQLYVTVSDTHLWIQTHFLTVTWNATWPIGATLELRRST